MVIYIKDNEIITELEYTEEVKAELLELGFQAITVPTIDEQSDYRYEMFEKVNGTWRPISINVL